MTEQDTVVEQPLDINSSLLTKKKKSKKSVAFDDEVEALTEKKSSKGQEDGDAAKSEAAAAATEPVTEAEVDELKDMFASMKKKKKSKKSSSSSSESSSKATEDGELDFSSMKKKKKKKKSADLSAFEKELEASSSKESGVKNQVFDEETMGEHEWIKSDRDYYYPELLNRFFTLLRQNNPELAGEKRKYTIVPPSVHREGNKKTIFANINDISKRMHRSLEHVIQFLFAELGTSGSVDGSSRLIIKGRFQQKQIENVLRRYIVEYVTCKTCKSPDTILTKENRIYFMTCEACGSTRSVQAIKTGYQAQIGKRRHMA
ncbi:translation initiation factor eIF2 beta subunit [Schizosaccharomyces japonicus yFS275]|uniref:Translation initiation factor eIF2 beta subunit n=1 Tax=Schizosaccharomyces japonicus (strain yFS275 / FY16936) TaxID=402676 RepID=B6K8C5_SCHJY|nr:translation initiation factor eIF2 beta subunit [Schizosaccharomyces japonicus yFS275]EEB09779.1 translation initiation factor eIF2 beta subunit [Schizosaccharomyces japonicus yFS275]